MLTPVKRDGNPEAVFRKGPIKRYRIELEGNSP